MNEVNLTLLKNYLETLKLEIARFDESAQSEDSASMRQLVEKCYNLAHGIIK